MKHFLLFLLTIPILAFGQSSEPFDHDNRETLLTKKKDFYSTTINEEITVRDSIHFKDVLSNGEEVITQKRISEFNNQGRVVYSNRQIDFNNDGEIEIVNDLTYFITPNNEYQRIVRNTANPDNLLLNARRDKVKTESGDPQKENEFIAEEWDETTQTWSNFFKNLNTLRTDEMEIFEVFGWDETNQEWVLDQKTEIEYYEQLNQRVTVYNYDHATQSYTPIFRNTTEFFSDGVYKSYHSWSYNTDLGQFEEDYHYEVYRDIPNHPDYSITKASWSGSFEYVDSCIITFSPDKLIDESLHYTFDISNQSFSLDNKSVYTYEDGNNTKLERYSWDGSQFELSNINLYFYSTRSLLTDQINIKNIPFKVSFENPAQQVILQVEGDDQIGTLQVELYDLTGKLLDQKQSSINQTLQLGNDRLESGVYIISIIENSKRYNWKVIIQ